MDFKKFPKWVKVLRIISIVLILLGTLFSAYLYTYFNETDGYIMLIIIPLLAICLGIVILWALGFFIAHLIKVNKKGVARVISILGLLISLIFLGYLISVINSMILLITIIGFILCLILLLYFVIALIKINN